MTFVPTSAFSPNEDGAGIFDERFAAAAGANMFAPLSIYRTHGHKVVPDGALQ
ncbi:hypothetical protein [Pseudorhodoplanes sp.]|uniref:hypothetical protein n=1 Tax=Pseudorhodoplanes sp. TaxID=1934341 RepID=UPI003D0D0EDE